MEQVNDVFFTCAILHNIILESIGYVDYDSDAEIMPLEDDNILSEEFIHDTRIPRKSDKDYTAFNDLLVNHFNLTTWIEFVIELTYLMILLYSNIFLK